MKWNPPPKMEMVGFAVLHAPCALLIEMGGYRVFHGKRQTMDTATILKRYVEAIIGNRQALDKADHKTANKHYKVLIKSLHQLEAAGSRREALLSLLDHNSPDVRGVAAAHLMNIEPEKAVPVLEEISQGSGVAGFEAKMVLNLWRDGKLRIP